MKEGFFKNYFFIIFIAFALVGICIPIVFYALFFWNNDISQDPEKWGPLGDYFGGILNPILGFLSFMALLYTIKLQRDSIELQNQELKATREELARSAQAQEASEKALAEQSNIFRQQQFETTFFSMLAHLNQLSTSLLEKKAEHIDPETDQIIQNLILKYRKGYYSMEYIQRIPDLYYPNWNQFSTFLYEVLKLIQTYNEEKHYSDILRASIHPSILQILAITTYRKDKESYNQYIQLFERYAFLENMPFKIANYSNEYNPLIELTSLYKLEAFGNSDYLKELNQTK